MRYYIECYDKEGCQILGNLDGQASIRCSHYRRTKAYKRVKQIVGNPRHMEGKVKHARIVTELGRIVEVIS